MFYIYPWINFATTLSGLNNSIRLQIFPVYWTVSFAIEFPTKTLSSHHWKEQLALFAVVLFLHGHAPKEYSIQSLISSNIWQTRTEPWRWMWHKHLKWHWCQSLALSAYGCLPVVTSMSSFKPTPIKTRVTTASLNAAQLLSPKSSLPFRLFCTMLVQTILCGMNVSH